LRRRLSRTPGTPREARVCAAGSRAPAAAAKKSPRGERKKKRRRLSGPRGSGQKKPARRAQKKSAAGSRAPAAAAKKKPARRAQKKSPRSGKPRAAARKYARSSMALFILYYVPFRRKIAAGVETCVLTWYGCVVAAVPSFLAPFARYAQSVTVCCAWYDCRAIFLPLHLVCAAGSGKRRRLS
jgi:hypothetical protein